MVKIPSMDDLKKAGAGFADKVKAGEFNYVVDKLKSGIDSVTKKDGAPAATGDNVLQNQIQTLKAALAELIQAQAVQSATIRKIESQLDMLSRSVDATVAASTPTTTTTETTTPEEKKTL